MEGLNSGYHYVVHNEARKSNSEDLINAAENCVTILCSVDEPMEANSSNGMGTFYFYLLHPLSDGIVVLCRLKLH